MRAAGFEVIRSDFAAIAEVLLFNAQQPEAPCWPTDAWYAFVAGQEGRPVARTLLLLRDGEDRLCGWLAGSQQGGTAELEFVLIAQGTRRSGQARRLLQEWMALAADQGCTEMLLEVRSSHQAARALYKGMGFVEQGRRPGYYRQPIEDAILMRRDLVTSPNGSGSGTTDDND